MPRAGSLGERVASVNSGESIFEMWERKRGRQGAGPTVVGVVVLVDMVRKMWKRRRRGVGEAILKEETWVLKIKADLRESWSQGSWVYVGTWVGTRPRVLE